MKNKINLNKDVSGEEIDYSDVIDYEHILNKYGPEGCYAIADKLKEIADKDIRESLSYKNNM